MSVTRSALTFSALGVIAFTSFKLAHQAGGMPQPTPIPVTVEAPAEAQIAVVQAEPAPVERVVEHVISSGETFGGILSRYGVTGVTAIVEAAADHKDLTRIRAGQALTFRYDGESPKSIAYALDEDRTLLIHLTGSCHMAGGLHPLTRCLTI